MDFIDSDLCHVNYFKQNVTFKYSNYLILVIIMFIQILLANVLLYFHIFYYYYNVLLTYCY